MRRLKPCNVRRKRHGRRGRVIMQWLAKLDEDGKVMPTLTLETMYSRIGGRWKRHTPKKVHRQSLTVT